MNKDKEYIGVGGHLFAIAAEALSKYNGTMYAFAANKQLAEYYEKKFVCGIYWYITLFGI